MPTQQLWLLRHGEAVPHESKPDSERELIAQHGDDARVLLVGHNPSFEQVVRDLTGARIDFKKGGVAAVRVSGTRGELLALLRPRELESLALSTLPEA